MVCGGLRRDFNDAGGNSICVGCVGGGKWKEWN